MVFIIIVKIIKVFVIWFVVAVLDVVVGLLAVLVLVVAGGEEELSMPGQPTSQSSQAP